MFYTIFYVWVIAFGIFTLAATRRFIDPKLTDLEKIHRNTRIWKIFGALSIVLGLAGLANQFFS